MSRRPAAPGPAREKNKLNAFSTDLAPPSERELIRDLTDDLRYAWEKLRAVAADLGEQRIYTSARAIMFARRVCYLFVRPQSYLQVNLILPEVVASPLIKRGNRVTDKRATNVFKLVHADQVDEPLTDWIRAAYDFAE